MAWPALSDLRCLRVLRNARKFARGVSEVRQQGPRRQAAAIVRYSPPYCRLAQLLCVRRFQHSLDRPTDAPTLTPAFGRRSYSMRLSRLVPSCVAGLGVVALFMAFSLLRSNCGTISTRAAVGISFTSHSNPGMVPPPDIVQQPPQQQPIPSIGSATALRGCVDDTLSARLKRRYLLTRHLLPAGVPGAGDEPLHLTFATASVDELLSNWAAHVRRLRLPAVVSAMDRVVLERCPRLRVHCLANLDESMDARMTAEATRNGLSDASSVNIRGNPTLFISLGARKVEAILTLLHATGRPVLVSDVDVVWMSDPSQLLSGALPGFEDLAHADILASTDCLDPALDLRDHGCFHVLQDRNTGVLLVRNTTDGVAAMREWKARTAGAFEAWETDQTAFDDLLRGRGRGHRRNMTRVQRDQWFVMKKAWCGYPPSTVEANTMGSESSLGGRATAGSRRLFDVCIPFVARRLRFGLLPLAGFANGHTFFVQQLQLQSGLWPYAVHATYQFEDAVDCAFGKRERMREWGLWLADEAEIAAEAEEEEELMADAEEAEADAAAAALGPAALAAAAAAGTSGGGGGGRRGANGGRGNLCPPSAARLLHARAAQAARPPPPPPPQFLVLIDDDPLPPSVPYSPLDPHARGRQHIEHMRAFWQQLADGVLLARALRRVVVLPPFHCYCDKYWARLTQCTIGHQALATQPLPFRCPMDHMLPIANWHGTTQERAKRRRCALPAEAHGPPENGMPYRTHGWLSSAQAKASLATFAGTLVPDLGGAPLAAAQRRDGRRRAFDMADARARLNYAFRGVPVGRFNYTSVREGVVEPPHGLDLFDGPTLAIPTNGTEASLRALVDNLLGTNRRGLLKVYLRDARSILGCVDNEAANNLLLERLFRMRWCWRPEEMTEPRVDPKTGSKVDVCIWNPPPPRSLRQCPRRVQLR